MPVNAGSISYRPAMLLPFKVSIARSASSGQTGRNMGLTTTWTLVQQFVSADVMPLTDDIYFLQQGVENIATHVIHFYAGTDILPKDNLQVLSSIRQAGPIGSWFEITTRVEPADSSIAYVRCHGRLTDAPVFS